MSEHKHYLEDPVTGAGKCMECGGAVKTICERDLEDLRHGVVALQALVGVRVDEREAALDLAERRKAALEAAYESMVTHLDELECDDCAPAFALVRAELHDEAGEAKSMTPPRYDSVFAEGTAALDAAARGETGDEAWEGPKP